MEKLGVSASSRRVERIKHLGVWAWAPHAAKADLHAVVGSGGIIIIVIIMIIICYKYVEEGSRAGPSDANAIHFW